MKQWGCDVQSLTRHLMMHQHKTTKAKVNMKAYSIAKSLLTKLLQWKKGLYKNINVLKITVVRNKVYLNRIDDAMRESWCWSNNLKQNDFKNHEKKNKSHTLTLKLHQYGIYKRWLPL